MTRGFGNSVFLGFWLFVGSIILGLIMLGVIVGVAIADDDKPEHVIELPVLSPQGQKDLVIQPAVRSGTAKPAAVINCRCWVGGRKTNLNDDREPRGTGPRMDLITLERNPRRPGCTPWPAQLNMQAGLR